MNITGILIDDDVEYANDMKYMIENFDETAFHNCDEITSIKIIVAADVNSATKIIQENSADIFLIDIELADSMQGHEFYDMLFIKGIDIPGIAVSAVVKTPEFEDEIKQKGISVVIHKMMGSKDLGQKIVDAICAVMKKKNIDQLEANVTHFDIENKTIKINSEFITIKDCLTGLHENKYDKNEDKEIRDAVRNECIEQDKFQQRSM